MRLPTLLISALLALTPLPAIAQQDDIDVNRSCAKGDHLGVQQLPERALPELSRLKGQEVLEFAKQVYVQMQLVRPDDVPEYEAYKASIKKDMWRSFLELVVPAGKIRVGEASSSQPLAVETATFARPRISQSEAFGATSATSKISSVVDAVGLPPTVSRASLATPRRQPLP